MSQTAAARSTTRTTLSSTAVGLVIVAAGILGILADRPTAPAPPSSPDARPPGTPDAFAQGPPSRSLPGQAMPRLDHGRVIAGDNGAITTEDGALPDGVTVFDDEYPGVANLDPDLLYALRLAAADASDAGIELHVNSGWRSAEYQRELFRDAVSRYGSEEEAARWVATADTSPHVSGNAVDIGSVDGTAWLREHGADYGLCQIYRNEPWHYELRQPIDRGCPRMYADSSDDPRLWPSSG